MAELLEENMEKAPLLVALFFFLDMKPKAQATGAKISQWDYIKLKCFSTSQETIKIKMQHIEWKKIFANYISDMGLLFKIIKFIQIYNKNHIV